jgi:hypothetical protein
MTTKGIYSGYAIEQRGKGGFYAVFHRVDGTVIEYHRNEDCRRPVQRRSDIFSENDLAALVESPEANDANDIAMFREALAALRAHKAEESAITFVQGEFIPYTPDRPK